MARRVSVPSIVCRHNENRRSFLHVKMSAHEKHSNIDRRKFTDIDERLPKCYADRQVDPKGPNGGAAGQRLAFENSAVPEKMPLPILTPWIDKPANPARPRIDSREIRAFIQVAWNAGPCTVFRSIEAAMYPGNDVIELERQVVVLLRHLAVFATVMCAFANQVLGSSIHIVQDAVFFNLPRILAFKIDRRWPTRI
jgi:hypothetical protein